MNQPCFFCWMIGVSPTFGGWPNAASWRRRCASAGASTWTFWVLGFRQYSTLSTKLSSSAASFASRSISLRMLLGAAGQTYSVEPDAVFLHALPPGRGESRISGTASPPDASSFCGPCAGAVSPESPVKAFATSS